MSVTQAVNRCSVEWGRPQNPDGDLMLEIAFQDALEAATDAGLVEIRYMQRIQHHPSGEVRVLVEGADVIPKLRLEHPPREAGWYGFHGWAEWRRIPGMEDAA